MPAVAAIPWLGTAIAGGAAAGATIYGSNKQSQATDQAAQIQAKANADAIALQKQELAQEQAQWQAQQQAAQQQWDQQQALRAPYRAAGQAALSKLGDQLGVAFQGYPAPAPVTSAPSAPPNSQQAAPTSNAAATGPAIIAQYQATHPATTDLSGILDALKAGGVAASPYMYGNTPSGNEINLGGQKYKVIAGEHTGNPSWYAAGTNDSAGGGVSAPVGSSLASLGINPLYDVTQTPYSQAVPFRNLLGA